MSTKADRSPVRASLASVFASASCVLFAVCLLPPDDARADAASPSVEAAIGLPGSGAPSGTTFDLDALGYEAAEYFLAGDARAYQPASGTAFLPDGAWQIEPDGALQPYVTRIQVYRPKNPRRFNGSVFVEWLNVSNQADTMPDWIYAHVELMRRGAVYVGVTAQAIGVNAAVALEPTRYGPGGAGLRHPGDSFSYDVFSQAGQAVRDHRALLPRGRRAERVIAMGESQSASRMVTYIDAVHPLVRVYDGFLVHSRGATGSALRQAPLDPIATPGPTLIRGDALEPVFVFQTETDTRATRQPDSATFRQWEVAGTAHADMYTLGIGQPDTGRSAEAAQRLFDAMLDPVNEPLPGILPPCTLPVNAGPHHWVLVAAVRHLDQWVRRGTPPPTGGAGIVEPLQLDADGNVVGGIRTPHVDVPVATLRGTGNSAPGPLNFCFLFGTTTPLAPERLDALYPSHGRFVLEWALSLFEAAFRGYVLLEDVPRLLRPVVTSTIGR
ncbi:MAG: alpha/beta hydrolase domain-containing protein [Myxococcota bacterium]